jgi:hypothetical protein
MTLHCITSHYVTLHDTTLPHMTWHCIASFWIKKWLQTDSAWHGMALQKRLTGPPNVWELASCSLPHPHFPLAGSSAKTFTVNSWNKKRKSIHATAVASISEWKVHERHWTVFYFGQASPTSCMPSFISYYPSTWRRTVDSVPSTAAYFRGIFRDSSIHLTACLCPPVPQHC